MIQTLHWPSWPSALRAVSFAAMLSLSHVAVGAESAVEKLTRFVNEVLVVRPVRLGVISVVLEDGQLAWTEVVLPFDELRPEPKRRAQELGWQPAEGVPVRISRDNSRVKICKRDAIEGC